ncbi:MAG: 30S ribosomal protein S13, partial [Thermoplasmata archaeon]|nr:30S ribosomal protein S13 [Thermoplasmata archaeon]
MGEPEKTEKKKKDKEDGKKKSEPAEEKAPKVHKEKVEVERLRVVGTDLDGYRPVVLALTDIKGIGLR